MCPCADTMTLVVYLSVNLVSMIPADRQGLQWRLCSSVLLFCDRLAWFEEDASLWCFYSSSSKRSASPSSQTSLRGTNGLSVKSSLSSSI